LEATVVILESVGAIFLVVASVLILRAWWGADQPGPSAPRLRIVRLRTVEAYHKRAA